MTRLLIVEDSATEAEALRCRLESAGYEVTVLPDGQRARNACSADGADDFIREPHKESYLLERVRCLLDKCKRERRLVPGVAHVLPGRELLIGAEKEPILDLLVSTFEELVCSNRELESRTVELNLILENIGDGVVVSDADGQLVLSNPMAEQLLGPAALMKRPLHWGPEHGFMKLDRRTPISVEELPLACALSGGSLDEVEMLVKTPQAPHGTYLSVSARPLRSDRGRVRGGVITFRDISERKRVEALIEAQAGELSRTKERAEQESRYKSRFLASMSHELRTPLNAIIGFSELLDQEFFGELSTRQKEYVGYVVSSGHHLLALVNDILDLSKIEAGRMELSREWVAPLRVIDAVHDSVRSLARKQGVTLGLDLPIELPDLYVDEMRLRQILYNLLSNGIKFTPSGGGVTLRAALQGDKLLVEVSDTGVGIRAEDLPRLFREFERIEQSGAKIEGTGLGLALTKRLVELHGGAIYVESKHQLGSKFTVSLPAFGARTLRDSERVIGEGSPAAPVLIVDDDARAAELIATTLRSAGLSVAVASDASSALELAERLCPTAITLDLHMPGIDGWALLTQLKRSPATARIPIIVCSVVDETSRALVLGATDYLVKPIASDALLRSLESIGIPLHRIAGLRVALVGGENERIEQHLRAGQGDVRRLSSLDQLTRASDGPPDVAIVDLSDTSAAHIERLSTTSLPFPVIALIGDVGGAPQWLPALEQLALRDAREPDRLVRAVHEAARRRTAPEWYAGTGLPGPSSLLAHLRTRVVQASFDTLKLVVAVAEVSPPVASVAAPWMQLLFQRLRQTDFLAAASERRLVLVVHACSPEDMAGIAERFRAVLTMILGLEVRSVTLLRYPEAGSTAEAIVATSLGPLES